jgi:glycosyltransferase involved in cell wall biosynthesis
MKILFFLESLHSGGKERRAVELFHFLKLNTNYEIEIVLTEKNIHYSYLLQLEIPIHYIERKYFKKDLMLFFKFFKIAKSFKPDIIHSWGGMTTLYAIPTAKYLKIPLINGQVADSISKEYRSKLMNIIWDINHYFSDYILSNSKSGLKAYEVKPEKGNVIYNGIRLKRFENLTDKNIVRKNFGINTQYAIIMVASFGKYKDYDLFFEVAKRVCEMRCDVTFLAVGEGYMKEKMAANYKSSRILFTGKISNVEALVSACDIGILFSQITTGEGISNAIMEYMALSKPVIATDAGGTSELVHNNISGFLVKDDKSIIISHINDLLNNPNLMTKMGIKGREIIENNFTVNYMGEKFSQFYKRVV